MGTSIGLPRFINWVTEWCASKDEQFYWRGILKLPKLHYRPCTEKRVILRWVPGNIKFTPINKQMSLRGGRSLPQGTETFCGKLIDIWKAMFDEREDKRQTTTLLKPNRMNAIKTFIRKLQ